MNEKPENWIKNNNTPLDFLALNQDTDGGIKNENINNKIWETAYTISALSGKNWNQTMQKFEKVITPIPEVKKEIPKTLQVSLNKIKKIKNKNLINQNTASVINAILPPTENQTIAPQKSWFRKLLTNIFGF